MPYRGNNSLSHNQLIMKLMNLPSANESLLCEEEVAADADEPPDDLSLPHHGYHSDGEFTKHSIAKPTPQSSLLTQALTSPKLVPVDRGFYSRRPLSASTGVSVWSLSGVSTAELTSDGGITSRSHSPSPPPSVLMINFLNGRQGMKPLPAEEKHVQIFDNDDDVEERLGRRRAIRFACLDELSPPRAKLAQLPSLSSKTIHSQPSNDGKVSQSQTLPQKRVCTLKFDCARPDELRKGRESNKDAPNHPTTNSTIKFITPNMSGSNSHTRQDPQATNTGQSPKTRGVSGAKEAKSALSASNSATRFYEFASSIEETESWMQRPPNGSRLLRVDGVLEKERDIQRLTKEAEAEVEQEELGVEAEENEDDEDDEDELNCEDDHSDGDEDEDGQDNDEEDEDEYLSGNESDNEEGFASDDDDEDDTFFFYGPALPAMVPRRPTCCRNASDSSVDSVKSDAWKRNRRAPSAFELPDPTDFVCGTFDEDKPALDAYVSAQQEKKRTKHITPYDIDPSFPESDPEDGQGNLLAFGGSENHIQIRCRNSFSDGTDGAEKRRRGILHQSPQAASGKIRFRSPALTTRRAQSPVPKRRMVSPPPPMSRRGSKHTSPPMSRRNSSDLSSPRPTTSRRGSRTLSPPQRSNCQIASRSRPGTERTKSLPKGIHSSNTGKPTTENRDLPKRPLRIEGRGLPQRSRIRNGPAKVKQHSWTRRGEGVEKMRELGLMQGKGKQQGWMVSI